MGPISSLRCFSIDLNITSDVRCDVRDRPLNILFMHSSFPGQFKYLSLYLSRMQHHRVTFITGDQNLELEGIDKIIYRPEQTISSNSHRLLQYYEKAIVVGDAAASEALKLREQGYKPDVIYGYSGSGVTLFIKDIFPDVPLISFCEWFLNADGPEAAFDEYLCDADDRIKIRCAYSGMLSDLCFCDSAVTSTHWQKRQFPEMFQRKINVIHEGIDTDTCKPDFGAEFYIRDKHLVLGSGDEVVTYGTRGMELYRGFPQFMEMVSKLQKKRPNVHVVVAGEDATFYGPPRCGDTWKEIMLKKFDYDMNRLHFVGTLPFSEYIKLLQISSVHVYLTYPYILSWSVLNAMATGCCVVASDTPPVLEVMKDNINGLLVQFHDVEQLTQKVEHVLNHRDQMKRIRYNARQTVLEHFDIRNLLNRQVLLIDNVIKEFHTKKMSLTEGRK